jgi:hypothetical protein
MKFRTRAFVASFAAFSMTGAMVAAPVVLSAAPVQAQPKNQAQNNLGQIVSGLVNVNVGAVAVNVGDITLEDLIDVGNVLSDNEIRALNNVLNNSPIASNNSEILTNVLQDANLITDNQVVVGVLSGGFVIADLL